MTYYSPLKRSCQAVSICLIALLACAIAVTISGCTQQSASTNDDPTKHIVRIVALPDAAAQSANQASLHIIGSNQNIYMPSDVTEKIAAIDGVTAASPQLYVQLEPSACCGVSADIKYLGYDASSDFAIGPLVEHQARAVDNTVIAGARVPIKEEDSVMIVGKVFSAIGKLPETNTGIDGCMVLDIEQLRTITNDAEDFKDLWRQHGSPKDLISSVMVDCDEADVDRVAQEISMIDGVTAAICDA